MTRDNIEMQRVILLNMDAPQHTRMRAIISRGFTPRLLVKGPIFLGLFGLPSLVAIGNVSCHEPAAVTS